MMRYVGIDVGKNRCRAAVMNEKGTIENEFFFENSNKGMNDGLWQKDQNPRGRALVM